jgi:hypothetical protein
VALANRRDAITITIFDRQQDPDIRTQHPSATPLSQRRLLHTGATRLIDEFFLESKANNESTATGYTADDALQLLRDMRAAGVYSHQWG